MTNLEPDVLFSQGCGRRVHNVLEAFKRLLVLLLRLINDTQSEVDLMSLVEVRLHLHDLGEGLFGMIQGTITVIQDTNAVPKSWLLRIA